MKEEVDNAGMETKDKNELGAEIRDNSIEDKEVGAGWRKMREMSGIVCDKGMAIVVKVTV